MQTKAREDQSESEILQNGDCQSTGAEPLPVSVPNHRTALTINACPPVQIPSALAPADPPKSIALPTPIAHASPAATPKSTAGSAALKMPVSVHCPKIAGGDTPPSCYSTPPLHSGTTLCSTHFPAIPNATICSSCMMQVAIPQQMCPRPCPHRVNLHSPGSPFLLLL